MTRAATVLGILVLALGGGVAADATGARPAAGPAKARVVPNVQKLTLAPAKSRIVAAGCKVGRVTYAASGRLKKGHVISHSPARGKHIASTRHCSPTRSIAPGQNPPRAMPCVNCLGVTAAERR